MTSVHLSKAIKNVLFAFFLSLLFFRSSASNDVPKSLSPAELSCLVDKALNDELFEMLTEADAKREIDIYTAKISISEEHWKGLASKKTLSNGETDSIFSFFGFKSAQEVKSYANLLASLGKKYGVDKLNENDQKTFFETLRKRQNKYIVDNNLLEKTFKKYSPTYADMPSECWKCVYDFRACSGGGGSWVISYTPVTSTTTTYNMMNGGISITQLTYTSPSNPTINYVNSSYSTSSCEGLYRNCIGSCKIPRV